MEYLKIEILERHSKQSFISSKIACTLYFENISYCFLQCIFLCYAFCNCILMERYYAQNLLSIEMLWHRLGEHFRFKRKVQEKPTLVYTRGCKNIKMICTFFVFSLLAQFKQQRSLPCSDSKCPCQVHPQLCFFSFLQSCIHWFILFRSKVSCLVVFRSCSWSALVCSFSVFYIKLSNRFWLWLLPHTLKRGGEKGKEGRESKMKKV